MKTENLFSNMITAMLIASLGVAVAIVAHAGSDNVSVSTEDRADAMFQRLDANRDNFVSREEAAKQPDFLKAFDAADDHHDGVLSRKKFANAYSIYDRIRVGAFIEDSVITAKIKAALIQDFTASIFDVSVETDRGAVRLSGLVANKRQAQRTLEIARAIDGVKNVKGSLTVKN